MKRIELNTKSLMGVRICAESFEDSVADQTTAEEMAVSAALGSKEGSPMKAVPGMLGRKEGINPDK